MASDRTPRADGRSEPATGPVGSIGELLVGWIVLLALLGLSVLSAYLKLGPFHAVVTFGIAGTQAAIVFIIFMHLRTSTALTRIFAAAGFFWLVFLFGLGLIDYVSRHGWPN